VRVILHTGKGGVGKTTMALATALGAARHGHRVFVLSTDTAHSIGDALGRTIGSSPVEVAQGVVAQEVGVLDEFDRAWSEIQEWLRELLRDETDEMVADELLVFPGMEELVSLRAVRTVEATGDFDVCVVDCAPTGATLRMLRFPDVLRIFMESFFDLERVGVRILRPLMEKMSAGRLLARAEFFDAFERLYRDIEDVRQILLDNQRTSTRLVVTPARVVVDEARRSFAYLSLYGVATDAVLVNRVLPEQAADGYFAHWAKREQEELAEIENCFAGVPLLRAPLHPKEVLGASAIAELAREVYGDRDPAAVYTTDRPICLRKEGSKTVLEILLRGVSKEEVDVVVAGADLHVQVRDAQRRIALPASLVGCRVDTARFADDVLQVVFAP